MFIIYLVLAVLSLVSGWWIGSRATVTIQEKPIRYAITMIISLAVFSTFNIGAIIAVLGATP